MALEIIVLILCQIHLGLLYRQLGLLVAAFMVGYGVHLCVVTWGNTIAEFPNLSTGVAYMPIPIGGQTLIDPAATTEPHLFYRAVRVPRGSHALSTEDNKN